MFLRFLHRLEIKGCTLVVFLGSAVILSAHGRNEQSVVRKFGKNDRTTIGSSHPFVPSPNKKGEAYLSSGHTPAVEVGSAKREGEPLVLSPSPDFVEPIPTFSAFLTYLEEEGTATALPPNDDTEASSEAKSDSAKSAPGSKTDTNRTEDGENEIVEGFFLRTQPEFPENLLFPRPQPFSLGREWIGIYFPVNESESEAGEVLFPLEYDSIFLPPGQPHLRSSATVKEGE